MGEKEHNSKLKLYFRSYGYLSIWYSSDFILGVED